MKYLTLLVCKVILCTVILAFLHADAIAQLTVRPNDTTSLHLMVEPVNTFFSAFYGVGAGSKNTGCCNTLLGWGAGANNRGGFENVFIGTEAGMNNKAGLRNTYVGRWAGKNTLGSDNTFIGKEAGANNTNGSSNTFIGESSGTFATGNGNIFLGHRAGHTESGNNKLYIENSDANASNALIYGEFDNDYLRTNGRLEVLSTSTAFGAITGIKTYAPGIFSDMPGVYGRNNVQDYYGIGVHGVGGYIGVLGESHQSGASSHYYGVQARAEGNNSGSNYALYAAASGGATNWAGYFEGNTYVAGLVGIGTTSFATGYRLSVNGRVACEEILVDLDGDWPDYVFNEDYQLRSLDELKEAIKIQGHLPDVPSAAHIEENGIVLGEMNKILLQKIEELTLYILDQEERIKALEKGEEEAVSFAKLRRPKKATSFAKASTVKKAEENQIHD